MTIRPSLERDVDFLANLHPSQLTLSLQRKGNDLIVRPIKRCKNLFRWVIYIITFTLIKPNPKLDKLTQDILSQIQNLDKSQITHSEKRLIKRSLKNLKQIVKNNEGSKRKDVKKLLRIVKSIQCLYQIVVIKEECQQIFPNQKNGEIKKNVDVPFLDLLNQIQGEKPGNEVANGLSLLLPQLNNTIALSDDQVKVLCKGFSHLDKDWILKNIRTLNDKTFQWMIGNCFAYDCGGFLTHLFDALTIEPVDKTKLLAWIQNIPTFKPELIPKDYRTKKVYDSLNQFGFEKGRITRFIHWRSFALSFFKQKTLNFHTIKTLEKNLSEKQFHDFIHHFFGLIAVGSDSEDPLLKETLEIVNDFSPSYRQSLLKTLCYAVDDDVLIKILRKSKKEDLVIKSILELNRPEQRDIFFENFILKVINDDKDRNKIISYIFQNETAERKVSFFEKMSTILKLVHFDEIPEEIMCDNSINLVSIARLAFQMHNPQLIQKIAGAIEARLKMNQLISYFLSSYFILALLPFFTAPTQQRLIGQALVAIEKEKMKNSFESFLQVTQNLPLHIWEEASKSIENLNFTNRIKDLPPNILAAVVNGQKRLEKL